MTKQQPPRAPLPLLGVANYWAIMIMPFMLLFFATNSIAAGIYVAFPLSLSCHIILAAVGQVRAKFGGPLLAILAFGLVILLLDESTFVASYDDYYIWPLLMLVSWPLLYFLREADNQPLGNYVITGTLMFAGLYPFFQNENQVTALFGANVLYRIVLLWYGLIAWGCIKQRHWAGFIVISGIAFWLINVVDSRAGQILYLAMLGIFLTNIFAPKLRSLILPVSTIILVVSVSNLQQVFTLLGELGINLSISNASESFRLLMIRDLMSPRIIFGDNYTIADLYTIFGSYPHSILVEAFAYHGIGFGTFITVVMVYCLTKIISQPNNLYLLGIVAGPLFSGDMRDNFPILIVAFHFAFEAYRSREHRTKRSQTRRRPHKTTKYSKKREIGVRKRPL
ncbi:hypothetical protein [Sphingorhabdus sp. Alg231-15]|uniref:hypothetical protein n=1 Tax=Sphingorhabdus sp. Alg231-15 TaxID=1922222 RepID=UPI00307C0C1C